MTEAIYLQPGDIFLTKGASFVSRAIRYFSRTGGESRTEVNHVGIVTVAGSTSRAIIVEASTVVKRHTMDGYRNSKSTEVAIYRPTNVTNDQMALIVKRAEGYVGKKYGYVKIVAHLFDWGLGGRYFFRRFAFMDKYPICSWVVASAYAEAGLFFGVEPGAASPDDIWDFVTTNSDKYTEIHSLKLLD